MQTMKVDYTHHHDAVRIMTPEKRAEKREKELLTFVVKATARDQEKNILISKLQREMSEAADDLETLRAEVKLKDKILHAKEDELLIMKSENETLKRQMQLLTSRMKLNDNKSPLKHVVLKKSESCSVKFNDNRTPLKPVRKRASFKIKSEVKVMDNNISLEPADLKTTSNVADHSPGPFTPLLSRKRSYKKPKEQTPKDNNNMANIYYNLRKKYKK